MPVVTLKAKITANRKRSTLHAKAKAQADRLVAAEKSQGPVLVVYGDQAASIYYEGAVPERPPAERTTA